MCTHIYTYYGTKCGGRYLSSLYRLLPYNYIQLYSLLYRTVVYFRFLFTATFTRKFAMKFYYKKKGKFTKRSINNQNFGPNRKEQK